MDQRLSGLVFFGFAISDRADDSAHIDFTRFAESIASRYTLAIVRRCLRDLG